MRAALLQLAEFELISLHEAGSCEIDHTETAFDLNHPSQLLPEPQAIHDSIPALAGDPHAAGADGDPGIRRRLRPRKRPLEPTVLRVDRVLSSPQAFSPRRRPDRG